MDILANVFFSALSAFLGTGLLPLLTRSATGPPALPRPHPAKPSLQLVPITFSGPLGGPPRCHQVVLAAPSPLPPVHSDLLHLSPRRREKAEATSQVPSSTCRSSPSSGQPRAAMPPPSVETLPLLANSGATLCAGGFFTSSI